MNQVYEEARDRVGQALHDHITAEIENVRGTGATSPAIDWHDGREYDTMAEKVLAAIWGASTNLPLVYAQFTTGGEIGLRGTQSVKVLKVEAMDDGALLVSLDYWPEQPKAPARPSGTNLIEHLAFKMKKAVEENKDELLKAWMARTGIDPQDAVLFTSTTYGPSGDGGTAMTQKFWVERKVDENREQALAKALQRMLNMHDAMFKQTNVGASWYSGETLQEMNEAPIEARRLLGGA